METVTVRSVRGRRGGSDRRRPVHESQGIPGPRSVCGGNENVRFILKNLKTGREKTCMSYYQNDWMTVYSLRRIVVRCPRDRVLSLPPPACLEVPRDPWETTKVRTLNRVVLVSGGSTGGPPSLGTAPSSHDRVASSLDQIDSGTGRRSSFPTCSRCGP